jgi:peptidoglycan/LPS O-acetylase OafA/YrhL
MEFVAWRYAMKVICVLLVTLFALGCGYSSHSGTMSMTPAIAQLMPNTATAYAAGFTLTVNGSNFASGAVVYWNGTTRATMFVTGSQVTAAITAADIAAAGTIPVYVRNPGATGIYMNQGSQNSNTMNFTVN